MLKHTDHKIPILRQFLEKLCIKIEISRIYDTFDIDLLKVASNPFKHIIKKMIRIFPYVIIKDGENQNGQTKIYLLQKVANDKEKQ